MPPPPRDVTKRNSKTGQKGSGSSPLALCIECEAPIHDDSKHLDCGICQHLFCFPCTKTTEKIFNSIGKGKSQGVLWVCQHCRISLPAARVILDKLNKSDEKQKELEARIASLERKLDETTKPQTLKASEPAAISDIVSEVLLEQKEREDKKRNIVISGLPESKKETDAERRADDLERIEDVVSNVMVLPDVRVNTPVRLGRFNPDRERPRMLRVTVDSVETKQDVIEKARTRVKNSRLEICQGLYFQSDLTFKQRQEAYKMRQERRRKLGEQQQTHSDKAPSSSATGASGPYAAPMLHMSPGSSAEGAEPPAHAFRQI